MKLWRPAPIMLPPIRAGEIDGRFIDLTNDLGAAGDSITSIDTVSFIITRRDGFSLTGDDLGLAGGSWPNAIDSTGLVVTVGLAPPFTSAGMSYGLAIMVNLTAQGRLFIRDLTIDVLASMG